MKSYRMYPTNVNMMFVDKITEALREGELIVYPTDTLYAIGCDALNNRAIEKLCKIKGINPDKQLLSVVCADISQAAEYARIDNKAYRLLKTNAPGPFTFILPASTKLPKIFKGRRTVGIRVPDNSIARAIAEALGNPILTTSIPFDGLDEMEITEPQSIAMRLENVADVMVDGGAGSVEQSTIVDCIDSSDPQIIREGKGTLE